MKKSGVNAPLFGITESPDCLKRFDRLRGALMAAGVADDLRRATELVVTAVMPTEAEVETGAWPVSTGTLCATVQTAHDFILKCEEAGVPLHDLSMRIRRTHRDSTWGQAVDILETHRQMTSVISAVRVPASANVAGRRRMRTI